MPKRLRDDEMDAALAAGKPPESGDYAEDPAWHRAQDSWLKKWRPTADKLPKPHNKRRRTEWDKLTKAHARAFAAAEKRKAQDALDAARKRSAAKRACAAGARVQPTSTAIHTGYPLGS